MGAWDITAFGNDDAADWASDLMESGEPDEFLEQTLALAKNKGYLEASEGCQLVAAAALIASACGGTAQALPNDLRGWMRGKENTLKSFAGAAALAIQRVRGEDSELCELWQEGDEFDAWKHGLDGIAASLR